jgi:hypothetical protein
MNRKLIAIIALFTLGINSLKAQDQKFQFGLKVSPTLAWMKPDTKGVSRDGSKLGFSYGLEADFNFATNYTFVTGLQVTYRGGGIKRNDVFIPYTEKWNLKYVELPLAIKLKTKSFDKIRYFTQLGLVPGYNISTKLDVPSDTDIDAHKDLRAFNLSMSIAAGAEYTISGPTKLFGSLEFNNGFVDIVKGGEHVSDYKGVTNFVALNIGVMF